MVPTHLRWRLSVREEQGKQAQGTEGRWDTACGRCEFSFKLASSALLSTAEVRWRSALTNRWRHTDSLLHNDVSLRSSVVVAVSFMRTPVDAASPRGGHARARHAANLLRLWPIGAGRGRPHAVLTPPPRLQLFRAPRDLMRPRLTKAGAPERGRGGEMSCTLADR